MIMLSYSLYSVLLYAQRVIRADATGIFLLALLLAPFIIPAIVKKVKISEAEEIKNSYPDGYKRVMRYPYSSIDYQDAKEIVNKRAQIILAQREYDEEKRKAAEEKYFRDKVNELRRSCPYATEGKTDSYIVNNEYSIRQIEQKHTERENRAKRILHDNPLGVKALYGFISAWRISDEDVDKLLINETTIRNKQKECEDNDAELKRLDPQLKELQKKYPLAIRRICAENKWSLSNAEHVKLLLSIPTGELDEKQQQIEKQNLTIFLTNKDKRAQVVKQAKGYIAQKNKEKAKIQITQIYGRQVAEKVMEIIASDEEFQAFSKHLDLIAQTQNDFAQATRSIFSSALDNWGWYKYDFEMTYVDDNTNVKTNTLTVWQAFHQACCFDNTVSYEYYPHYKQNRIFKGQLEGAYHYNEQIWDKVLSFIINLKDKYGDELFVILANTDHLDDNAFHSNFCYIEEQLRIKGIRYGETILEEEPDSSNKKYVVIDIITENADLIRYCSSIFHYRHIMHIRSNHGTSGVVYISMLKCFDGAEVEELNKKRKKEDDDKLRRAKEEEEKRQQEHRDILEAKSIASAYPLGFKRYFPDASSYSIDASQARLIIRNRSAIQDYEDTLSRLRNRVSDWDTVRGVHHYFFYYYYPTRFTKISTDSQEARRLVYNFKDGIAHDKVKDLVVNKIRSTFNSNDLSKMCFTCIPASTRSVHQSRYKDFSNEVCHALGMSNAYYHITITKEKTPSHLGGDDQAEYSYDGSFFSGKFVVLFDDIVTRGDSISSMEAELEALGATVICAISIGRTYSDWNGNTPKPHPYTGRV